MGINVSGVPPTNAITGGGSTESYDNTGALTFTATQPASVATTPGTAAPDWTWTGATGGTTSIATTGTGGTGTDFAVTMGTGGVASAAVTASTGGRGGNFTALLGNGGAANNAANVGTNLGGKGGSGTLQAGSGGNAANGTDTGGAGGDWNVTAGTGGNGDTGGVGGALSFTAGDAGTGGNVNGGAITMTAGRATGSGAEGTFTVIAAGTTLLTVGTGGVIVGPASAASTPSLIVQSTIATSPRGIASFQNNAGTDGARVGFFKSRGTYASPSIITTGDTLGRLMFRGHDGTANGLASYLEMASIEAVATGTIAATRVPTYLAFSTATDAAPSVLTEWMRLTSAGKFVVHSSGLTVANIPEIGNANTGTSYIASDNDYAALCLSAAGTVGATNAVPFIQAYAARGTHAAKTAVQNGDQLFEIDVVGSDGTDPNTYWGGAQIQVFVDGAVNTVTHAVPSRLVFTTGPTNDWHKIERMRIDSAGRVGIGAAATTWAVEVTGATAATSATQMLRNSGDTGGSNILLAKSRGAVGAPTVITTGDALGSLAWGGYDGAAYQYTAQISAVSEGTIGAGRVPTRLVFYTGTDEATTVLTERMRIDSAGLVTLASGMLLTAGTVKGNGLALPHVVNKAASANVRNSHDAETSTVATGYTKLKTITITNGLLGAQRFLFDLKTAGGAATATGRIYRNGVALGTEQTDVTGGYVTKSEDLTQTWNPGDTAELYAKTSDGAQAAYVQNFRIAYDDSATIAVASANS